jgi:hypothetical protein
MKRINLPSRWGWRSVHYTHPLAFISALMTRQKPTPSTSSLKAERRKERKRERTPELVF